MFLVKSEVFCLPQDNTSLKALKAVSIASTLVTEVEGKSSKAYSLPMLKLPSKKVSSLVRNPGSLFPASTWHWAPGLGSWAWYKWLTSCSLCLLNHNNLPNSLSPHFRNRPTVRPHTMLRHPQLCLGFATSRWPENTLWLSFKIITKIKNEGWSGLAFMNHQNLLGSHEWQQRQKEAESRAQRHPARTQSEPFPTFSLHGDLFVAPWKCQALVHFRVFRTDDNKACFVSAFCTFFLPQKSPPEGVPMVLENPVDPWHNINQL